MKNEEITKCRGCGYKSLLFILDLGNQYVTNFVENGNNEGVKCPLELVLCENCKLLQLKHNAPAEAMWNEQYWYKSNISITIKDNLKDIVEKSTEIKKLKEGDLVIDIGCNDGTLLSNYDKNLIRGGFEPSNNVACEASEKGFEVVKDFFNSKDFKERFGGGRAKIITAISMFYDLEDPNEFMRDIIECLDKEGLFVIQQNYLLTMLTNNAFDNICHEHREYYSLISLKNLLNKYELEIFDVEQNEINGGSIRTYIKFKDNKNFGGSKKAQERIEKILDKEKEMELDTIKPYQEFASRIKNLKENLMKFVKEKKKEGKNFWIYGASTRGNVILQYYGLNEKLIDAIADKNPDKKGKKTIGTLIPIYDPEKLRKTNPDYLIVMVWHFFNEIKNQEIDYFKKGGKFVVPLPEFRVIKY